MGDRRRRAAADAWGGVLRVHAAIVPELDRTIRPAGLSLAWYDVLLELAHATDGRLTMTQLADRVTLSRTRVSRVVDELTDAGLVRRVANPADARSAFASITAAGRRRFGQVAPTYLDGIEQQFATPLTDTELRTLAELLDRVVRHARGG